MLHCCPYVSVHAFLQVALLATGQSVCSRGWIPLSLRAVAGFAEVQRACRHAVDMHLQRWPHAMHDLLAAGDDHFEAALSLAQEQVRQLLWVRQGVADVQFCLRLRAASPSMMRAKVDDCVLCRQSVYTIAPASPCGP